jgi:hypothetical protein
VKLSIGRLGLSSPPQERDTVVDVDVWLDSEELQDDASFRVATDHDVREIAPCPQGS